MPAMPDANDENNQQVVPDLVDHTVVTNPNPPALLVMELFAIVRSRIFFELEQTLVDSIRNPHGQTVEFLERGFRQQDTITHLALRAAR